MEAVKVHNCARCDSKFCDECGDLMHKLCYDCQGWGSEELLENWEQEDIEVEWDSTEPN